MSSRSISHKVGLDRFSSLYIFALFFAVFAIWTPNLFLSKVTLYSVADVNAIIALLGMAVVVPLAAGAYDLSVGATIGFSAVLVTVLQNDHHVNVWVAVVSAVATGAVIGAINGLVVVRFHVNSFITTLGMGSIVAATQTIVSDNRQPLPVASSTFRNIAQHQIGGFQIVVLYLLGFTLIFWWLMERAPMGRYLYAIGGNPEAARLSGVNVGKWTWLSLIISGAVAGFGGVLYASQNGPSLTFGPALLLPAFAAAFLGSTQIRPGRVNALGTVLAVYVLATGVKGLQLVTGVQWLNDMFNGVALIAAVGFAVSQQRRVVRAGTATSDPGAETFEAAGTDIRRPGAESAYPVAEPPPDVDSDVGATVRGR